MPIHVQTWPSSGSARITDMTHAGRRGKKCRVLRLSGVSWDEWSVRGDTIKEAAAIRSRELLRAAESQSPGDCFDRARELVRDLIAVARGEGVPEGYLTSYDEEIRGVDAPREKLTAGLVGVWSASADEGGISLHDLKDVNEWTEVTHGQTNARAYDIARKVWEEVKQARTLHEASNILRAAGAKLHGFCAMD